MTAFFDRSSGEHVELTDFKPKEANYSGTAYQYKVGDKRNSRNVANMKGRFAAADAKDNIPTGSTTDFKAPATDHLKPFTPNKHNNQEGAWN